MYQVYLLNGEVHLVEGEDYEEPTDVNCLDLVRDAQEETRASDQVQAAIQARVQGWEFLHKTEDLIQRIKNWNHASY